MCNPSGDFVFIVDWKPKPEMVQQNKNETDSDRQIQASQSNAVHVANASLKHLSSQLSPTAPSVSGRI